MDRPFVLLLLHASMALLVGEKGILDSLRLRNLLFLKYIKLQTFRCLLLSNNTYIKRLIIEGLLYKIFNKQKPQSYITRLRNRSESKAP